MSRFNFIIISSLVLSSCSVFKPYVDRKRSAGQSVENLYVGKSSPKNPVICYSSFTTTLDEVKKMAADECVKQKTGTTATPIAMSSFSCTLFAPNTITFECN